MKKYPSINDLFIEGEEVTLTKEKELEIIRYMEQYAQSVENNEAEAYNHAATIVLNC